MASVTLDKVLKVYGSGRNAVCALDQVSLNVRNHELLVLVGPSGCGKSSSLRLIAGLDRPDAGTIRIEDRIVNDVPPHRRDVALVFQDFALYPTMNVYKNLAFALKMRRVPRDRIDRQVRQAAEWLELSDLFDRLPATLSGGEKQRTALGRALVRRPRVFLLDEPLASLDASLRTRLRTEIKALHQRLAATMIYVTHDQEEAMTLGDRIAIMKNGVIQQCGTPIDVYNRPANRFVASFIGQPAMSFLRATLVRDRDRLHFQTQCGAQLPFPSDSLGSEQEPPSPDVVLGLRPEHVIPQGLEHDGRNTTAQENNGLVSVTVNVVEPLGDRTYLHATTRAEERIVARVPPGMSCRAGDELRWQLDMNNVHLFADDKTGLRWSRDRKT